MALPVTDALAAPVATIDDVKTYWDRRPCNVRHSKLTIGTKEYFDTRWRRVDISSSLTSPINSV